MEWLLQLTFGLAVLYAVLTFVLSRFPPPQPQNQTPFKVAVLIAMRNEENVIADCLNSLQQQTYPTSQFEVFVLDDASTDASVPIATQFVKNNSNFHLLKITTPVAQLTGKMNVLAQGLRHLDHDLVLITDADCVVPPTWIERMVSYFEEQVGMVGGFTCLFPFDELNITRPKTGFWAKVQALDWAYLQAMAAFNSNAGKPISILGNNFAFRLKAYKEVGGFEKIGFSVTEDFALMEALRKQTQWKIVHTLDAQNTVYSHPLPDLKSFFRQRLRWIKGGKAMRPWGYFVTFFSTLTHFFVLLALFWHFSNVQFWVALGLLFISDFFTLLQPLKTLRLTHLLKTFWGFEIFYFAYLLIFSVLSFLPLKISWKDRSLS